MARGHSGNDTELGTHVGRILRVLGIHSRRIWVVGIGIVLKK